MADQTDPRLHSLFQQLHMASTAAESKGVELEIWGVWLQVPDDAAQSVLKTGIAAMSVGDLGGALKLFDEIVENAPAFAEGWNKRATVHYLMGDFQKSLTDIEETLILEPRHFGA